MLLCSSCPTEYFGIDRYYSQGLGNLAYTGLSFFGGRFTHFPKTKPEYVTESPFASFVYSPSGVYLISHIISLFITRCPFVTSNLRGQQMNSPLLSRYCLQPRCQRINTPEADAAPRCAIEKGAARPGLQLRTRRAGSHTADRRQQTALEQTQLVLVEQMDS